MEAKRCSFGLFIFLELRLFWVSAHSEKAWAVILAQGGVRVPELNKVEERFCAYSESLWALPRIGQAQHLHLAACPVIDADHQGQALPTPIYLLFSKKKESSALSSSGWGRDSSSPHATPPSSAPCESHGGHVIQACLCIGIRVATDPMLPGG